MLSMEYLLKIFSRIAIFPLIQKSYSDNMKQISISSFFKSNGTTNKRLLQTETEELSSESKRQKLNKENFESTNGTLQSAQLPPTKLLQIEKNKLNAKIKLQAKKTPLLPTNIGLSWFKALESEFSKDYFIKLNNFLLAERKGRTIFPPESKVFAWTQMCDINEVKVVILGQDPYHGYGQAHGLAFSVPAGISIPPSLINMHKELAESISGFVKPNHGNLTGWATQGVLLLNACLTVRANQANSHKDQGWEQLTDAVIKWLNDNLTNVVFLLWGSYAQKKGAFINKGKHLVLQCPHPSPFSASRGFFDCGHFLKANNYLVKNKKKPINWMHLPTNL